MQGTVIIGLIQMAVGNDPDVMLKKAQDKVEQAAKAGANIICLPELFKTRYFPKHIGVNASAFAETVPGASTHIFSEIARAHNVVIIVPLYEKTPEGRFYNTAVVIDADGTLHPPYHKVHIPQDPGFFEKGYFYPGEGYRVFDTRYGRIAVMICFDQWFPEAARCVALDGAEIIIYPTAIGHPGGDEPAEGDWHEAWELIRWILTKTPVALIDRQYQGMMPTYKPFASSSAWLEAEPLYNRSLLIELERGHSFPLFTPGWQEWRDNNLTPEMMLMIRGEKPVEKCAADAQERINAVLDRTYTP